MVTKGVESATVARLEGTSLSIGRQAPADLVIDNQFVSRSHALVIPTESGYSIADQGSKNGTSVNNTPIDRSPVALNDGDVITIADGEVELRYQSSAATATVRVSKERPAVTESRISTLSVDSSSRTVLVNGLPLDPPLVGRQYALLARLAETTGVACSWDDLAKAGWPDRSPEMVGRNEVIQAIHEIRKRLESTNAESKLVSVRGFGYRLEA